MAVKTVKRRGKRRYVIDIPYTKSDGTRGRYRRDAEVQTRAAARAEDRRRLGMLATTGAPEVEAPEIDDEPNELTSITFAKLAAEYLEVYGETRLKPSTKRSYQNVIDHFLLPRIGSRKIDSIGSQQMRALDREMVRRKTKPSTRRNMQVVLRSMCRYAVEAGYLEAMPRFPRLPKVGVSARSVLRHEDVLKLLEHTPEPYHLAFQLAAYAGLRAGEVRGILWDDVDLDRGVLVVRRSVCHGIEAPPKSGHERRVPLHPELKSALELAPRLHKSHPVTGPEPGERWGEYALSQAFNRFSRAAELEGFRFHDLRHAFVTNLFRGGASAPVVRQLAGHECLLTTQRYAHAVEEDLAKAIHNLGSA